MPLGTEESLKGPVWLMQPIPYFGEKLEEDKWVVEPKIDGWRLQVIKGLDGKVSLWGRRLEKRPNWTDKLSSVKERALQLLPNGTLLDAELYSTGGRRFIPSLFALSPKVKPIVYVFDVIFWGGEFVGDLSLRKRRAILESIRWAPPFRLIPQEPLVDLHSALVRALELGYEGIIIKRLDSKYRIGKGAPEATASWRKLKGS
jgi:ATP-dependent DNA ligase